MSKPTVRLLLALLLLLLTAGFPAVAAAKPHVLFISSYHPSFPTFFQQVDGLRQGFGDSVRLDIEFMDSKRFFTEDNLRNFETSLRYKLQNSPPHNAVITADDNALKFVLNHRNDIFRNIPVVFFGVNNVELARSLESDPEITGVVEAISPGATVSLARRLFPDRKKMTVITDPTPSGQSDSHTIRSTAATFDDLTLNVLDLSELSWSELASELSAEEDSFVLLLSAYRDKNGATRLFSDGLRLILAATRAPVFHLWEHGVGEGILGGKVVSHLRQAEIAAQTALRIIEGASPGDIPIVESEDANIYLFDHPELKRRGLSEKDLPASSIVLNTTPSLMETHATELTMAGTFAVGMIVVMGALIHKNLAIRRLEKKYRTYIQSATAGIMVVGKDGTILEVNPELCRLFGRSAHDLTGRRATEMLDMDETTFLQSLSRDLAEQGRFRGRIVIHGPNNAAVPASVDAVILDNERILIFFGDITEHEQNRSRLDEANTKLVSLNAELMAAYEDLLSTNQELQEEVTRREQVQAELRDSEAMLRSIFRAAPIGLSIIRDGIIDMCNDAMSVITGYSSESLTGMSLRDLFPSQTEFDRVEHTPEADEYVPGAGSITTVFRKADGETRHVALSSANLGAKDSDRGTIFAVMDITEQIHAEEARTELENFYTRLFEESLLIKLLVNPETGTIINANPAASEFYGYSREDLIGRNISAINTLTPDEVAEEMAAAKEHNRNYFAFKHLVSDGSVRDVAVSSVPVNLGGRKLLYSIIHDMTAVKQAEEQSRRAREMAEYASRLKDEFLANMSHEIRTPLNGVLGMLQLMQLTELTEEQAQYTRTAISSGNALLALISDILDLTRIEANRLELHTRPTVIRDVLSNVISAVRQAADAKGIKITTETAPGTPPVIITDGGRLRQILLNLVGNSVKFADGGAVRIFVTRLPAGAAPGRVLLHFCVSDDGPGIPDDYVNIVFQTFAQAEGSYSRRFQGAGLGLGIVRRLVPMLGGNIAIDTEEGKGTDIHFTINAELPEEERDDPEYCELPVHPGAAILVAEDNEINRITACGFVEALGYRALAATNGEQALDMLASNRVAAVLMDIQMPVVDGIEATRIIRNSSGDHFSPELPIIAMTAHAMRGDRDLFIEAGMDAYISKPFSLEELSQMLNNIFSRPAAV